MSRWQAWSLHILTSTVSVTGILYFCMKYLMEAPDPFSVVNHPLQTLALDIHIVASPLLIFIVGIIFNSHIGGKLGKEYRANRCSGMTTLICFPLMVISGYLLQVFSHPTAQRMALIAHLLTSAVFVVIYLFHQIISFRLIRGSGNAVELPSPGDTG